MKNSSLKYVALIFLLGTFISNLLFAEEKIYPYMFNPDTTLTGLIIDDGHIFEANSLTYISIYNTFKYENLPPSILFYDENYHEVKRITLTSPESAILRNPLVFDFDGDSLDEVIFTVRGPNKLSFIYFDPSNNPMVTETFFEIPIKGIYLNVEVNVIPAQLDNDNFYEVVITSSERIIREYSRPGMWAVDIKDKKLLWEKFFAANSTKNNPINFISEGQSNIIYSVSSKKIPAITFYYSNGFFHFYNKDRGNKRIYDKNFNENNYAILDSLSDDFEVDSVAFISSITSENKLNWKTIINEKIGILLFHMIKINNEDKLLVSYSFLRETYLKIIDPTTGAIEKEKKFDDIFKVDVLNNKIMLRRATLFKILDSNFNPVSVISTKFPNTMLAKVQLNNEQLYILIEGSGVVQSLIARDKNLNIVAFLEKKGVLLYLKNSNIVPAYNSATRKSTLYSLQVVKWYNKITSNTLRTIVISFLIIMTLIMLLWINTLWVSTKKIKRQKNELEESHAELKETTEKLIEVEKLAVYGTIAGSIAHEINSPLGAIINSAQRIKTDKNADFDKNIELIEKAGKRSKYIIDKLLIGTPNSIMDSTSILSDVINDWRALSAKQFDNLGIILETKIECDDKLAISSTQLNQILTNLLFNARDSIMESNNSNKTIIIESSRINSNCLISIQDTGTGFSPAKLERPFEAFKTSKKRGQGTGLGLWIIKRILDEIRGEINIHNCEIGAKVEIIIPLFLEKQND